MNWMTFFKICFFFDPICRWAVENAELLTEYIAPIIALNF